MSTKSSKPGDAAGAAVDPNSPSVARMARREAVLSDQR